LGKIVAPLAVLLSSVESSAVPHSAGCFASESESHLRNRAVRKYRIHTVLGESFKSCESALVKVLSVAGRNCWRDTL